MQHSIHIIAGRKGQKRDRNRYRHRYRYRYRCHVAGPETIKTTTTISTLYCSIKV